MTAQALTASDIYTGNEAAMCRDWQTHMDGPYPGDAGNGPFEPWPIEQMTKEQLAAAYAMALEDLQWSPGEGLDHANAMRRCEIIRQEAERRGYTKEE